MHLGAQRSPLFTFSTKTARAPSPGSEAPNDGVGGGVHLDDPVVELVRDQKVTGLVEPSVVVTVPGPTLVAGGRRVDRHARDGDHRREERDKKQLRSVRDIQVRHAEPTTAIVVDSLLTKKKCQSCPFKKPKAAAGRIAMAKMTRHMTSLSWPPNRRLLWWLIFCSTRRRTGGRPLNRLGPQLPPARQTLTVAFFA